MSNEPEILVTGEMTNVCRVTGDQIVDGDHAMAFGQKPIYQMRAEETRAAGHNGNRLGWGGSHIRLYLAVDLKIASTKQTFVIPSGVEESLESMLRSIGEYKMRSFDFAQDDR